VPTHHTGDGELAAYIREYQGGGQAVSHVKDLVCARCRGTVFLLSVDDDEGCVVATCRKCLAGRPIADSAERLQDADIGECDCVCGGDTFAVAVGFAADQGGEVSWVTVGLRCLTDDVLGVIADWKVDYRPSAHLLTSV
jgi:hypothetical protein